MIYLPLSDDYRESSKQMYRIKVDFLEFTCRNIINELTSETPNELLTWAKKNELNMLHLLRFLRYSNSNYCNVDIDTGDYENSLDSLEYLDSDYGQEPLRTVDGFFYVCINQKKIVLGVKERSKERDEFIDFCPIDFGYDFKGLKIVKNRLFLSMLYQDLAYFLNNFDYSKISDIFNDMTIEGFSEKANTFINEFLIKNEKYT